MSLGAATIDAEAGKAPGSPTFLVRLSFAGDDSYTNNGSAGFLALVQAAAGGRALTVMDVISGDCADNQCEYDRSGDLLNVRVGSTGAEVGNGVDLSGTTFNLTAICQ